MGLVNIGKQLARRRKELNLRQEDLAEMTGITPRTVYNIEAGKGNPSFKTLSGLCETLGLEININIKMLDQ